MYTSKILSIATLSITYVGLSACTVIDPQIRYGNLGGPYAAAHVSHTSMKSDSKGNYPSQTYKWDTKPKGIGAGVAVGYDIQAGSLLYGVEADAGHSGADKDCYTDGDTEACDDIGFSGHLRGRVGYIFGDNLLIYTTAGLALADVEHSDNDVNGSAGNASDSKDTTRVGYSVGAGIEVPVADKISVRGEYLYDDYGSKDIHLSPASEFGTSQSRDLDSHTIKLGVKYKF